MGDGGGGRGGWRGHGAPGHGRGGGSGSAGGDAGRVAWLGGCCPLQARLAKCLVSYLVCCKKDCANCYQAYAAGIKIR